VLLKTKPDYEHSNLERSHFSIVVKDQSKVSMSLRRPAHDEMEISSAVETMESSSTLSREEMKSLIANLKLNPKEKLVEILACGCYWTSGNHRWTPRPDFFFCKKHAAQCQVLNDKMKDLKSQIMDATNAIERIVHDAKCQPIIPREEWESLQQD